MAAQMYTAQAADVQMIQALLQAMYVRLATCEERIAEHPKLSWFLFLRPLYAVVLLFVFSSGYALSLPQQKPERTATQG